MNAINMNAAIIEDTAGNAEICDVKIRDLDDVTHNNEDTSVEIFLPMNSLTKDDLHDIKSQINEIVQHAEVLVNALLIGDAFRIASEFHELHEHILEAPEEFRTEFNEQGRGDVNEASLEQCRQKLFEPERAFAEHNHDNGSGPEAVPSGWPAPEEVKTCENETITKEEAPRVDRVNISKEPQENIELNSDATITDLVANFGDLRITNTTNFDDLNQQIDGTNAALKEIQNLFNEELESSLDNPLEHEQPNTIDSARDSSLQTKDKIATNQITNGLYAPSDPPFTKTNEHRGGGTSGHPKKPELVNDAVNARPCDTVPSAKNTVSSDGDDVKHYGQFNDDNPRESGLINGLKCDLDSELDDNELDLRELFEICDSLRGVLQGCDDYRNRLNREDNMYPSVNLKTIVEEEDEIVYSGGNNNKLMRNNNVVSLPEELPTGPRELPESRVVIDEVSLKNTNKYNYESYFDSLLSSPPFAKGSSHNKAQLPDQLSLEAISAKLNDLDLNQVLKYRKFDDLGNNLDASDEREIQEDAEFEFIEELLRSLEDDTNKDGIPPGDMQGPLETLDEVEETMLEELETNSVAICNNVVDIAGVSNNSKNVCESGIETGDVDNMNSGNVPTDCVSTSCNGISLVNDVGSNLVESTPTASDQSAGRQCESAMVGDEVEFSTSERAWGTSDDGGRCDGVACATTKTSTSIRTDGVERDAQPPGCSREPTAKVCTALDTTPTSGAHLQTQQSITLKSDRTEEAAKSASAVSNLSWGFRNGRLVFDVPCDQSCSDDDQSSSNVLKSKDVNKKSPEGRLKFLGEKLKEAGITDGRNEEPAIGLQTSSFEDPSSEEDLIPEDPEDLTTSFCEFDPHTIHKFHNSSNFFEIYDELNEEDVEYEEDEEDEQDEEYEQEDQDEQNEQNKQTKETTTMRGDGGMGTNERKQHNPNRDNLKSLLKKPGRNKEKKNRVIFNETKNEFFDADYIILIREECDYDEEEDDGVCTCNQHEMVRLTCCEPNCNCNVYEGYDPTPQSPKFAPPLEFVDAVTLSPPEEYKDMELEEQQLLALQQQMARRGQRAPVCRECSASHDDEGDGSVSDNEEGGEKAVEDHEDVEEKEKTDQSQQTTPTTPPPNTDTNDEGQRYILETLTMTTVSERQIIKEAEESQKNAQNSSSNNLPPNGSPISGILKGGRLWKQTSAEINNARTAEPQQAPDNNITSDDEGNNKRSVRFSEANSSSKQRDVCDGAPEKSPEEEAPKVEVNEEETTAAKGGARPTNPTGGNAAFGGNGGINTTSPESTEMMLTFKLGNHVLISNNSLKPNSAVRQLFPCTKPMAGKPVEETAEPHHQYLVTAESLKAFEEAKRSKLPQIIQSGETDDSIRRAIERNTLRRSLIRYEPKSRKATQKTDNSLVERIKQLTCDVDEVDAKTNRDPDDPNHQQRSSPPGEEARNSPEVNKINHQDKSFSPSSSSTASSNSSSMSSTYKKITDLFAKRDRPDIVEQPKPLHMSSAPDLGNGPQEYPEAAHILVKGNASNEHRKQFLSTLAPLTACVSGMGPVEEYYHMNNHNQGDRTSMASSAGTEYSLEDIDEVLRKDEEDTKKIAPDVLAGTPSASESGDELAMFVQQDAGRIERIKKKYQPEATEDDDEHDDYGFNRRPSVRGIKPRFGSTTEILQQIQNQMQPPTNNTPPRNHVAWPYYSETNLSTNVDNTKPRNINQNGPPPPYPYPNQTAEDIKRAYAAHQYRPTSYIEENIYQNCTDQRCTQQVNYRTNMNVYPSVVRVGGGCSDYYASLPRNRNGRPQSPPPQEVSKNYHQTMVYIPYNHIEGYHPAMSSPNPYYSSADACYARVTNQNQINKRYVEATYQRIEDHYSKPVVRQSYARSESPQISTARSTQTPVPNCTYYPPRYRAMVPNGVVWQEGAYVAKINRHSFPMPRYPPSDSLSLTDSDSQHSNGYRETTFGVQKDSMPNSPTKTRFIERGVPEGAASVSPQDSVTQNSSTMTSPTSPQNPQPQGAKPLFYAMNV